MKVILVLLSVLVAVCSSTKPKNPPKFGKRIPQTLSRGWGDQLIWAQTYEEGLFWSRFSSKPLMVIFHLEDCPHSAAMKKVFADNRELQKLLDDGFIVLNLMYETTDKHLSPMGSIPPESCLSVRYGRLCSDRGSHGFSGLFEQRAARFIECVPCHHPDPSMTVRADITGRYSNRMYAYEPEDMKFCK
ncbi:hypothetical protein NHX12_024338 [Muraenolepis orangiensis]|uniref:Uncharacterized protein n=1 Tax=Muraenolepis orangiensis TaxID=630683 RepID=A0A9Q0EQL6_9TELE|nr:hypothetical protein NHX12_024338 [Muraenolepis orangiensis]